MTDLLQKAFDEAARLPRQQQDELARRWLAELADEQAWDHRFAASQDALAKLAQDALAEYESGATQDMESHAP